jgi:hypothetical protein
LLLESVAIKPTTPLDFVADAKGDVTISTAAELKTLPAPTRP